MLDVRFALSILDELRDSVIYDTLKAALYIASETIMGQPSQQWKDSRGSNKWAVNFHQEGRQKAWEDLVLSCPSDSPCRMESGAEKNTTNHDDLGFVRSFA
jgi:hypothetical protein